MAKFQRKYGRAQVDLPRRSRRERLRRDQFVLVAPKKWCANGRASQAENLTAAICLDSGCAGRRHRVQPTPRRFLFRLLQRPGFSRRGSRFVILSWFCANLKARLKTRTGESARSVSGKDRSTASLLSLPIVRALISCSHALGQKASREACCTTAGRDSKARPPLLRESRADNQRPGIRPLVQGAGRSGGAIPRSRHPRFADSACGRQATESFRSNRASGADA